VVPVMPVGKLVLNRNPDNFFAESEQVAFNPGHVVPGIDFSNDPLLQGRLFAYTDAQLARLGGANYHELPINRGVCPFHNYGRDGAHRMTLHKGQVAYEPNSLASGAEFRVDGGQQGFQSAPEAIEPPKIRRRSTTFDDHFSQARLFWNSQSQVEKDHIVAAFQYELAKVQAAAIRQRVVDNLAHVDSKLARKIAEPLGIDPPDAKAAAGRAGFRETQAQPPVEASPSLSMEGGNGTSIATRRVAVLVASGVEVGALRAVQQALQDGGATTDIIASHLGSVATASGQQLAVDRSFCTTCSVLYDAVLVPGGASAQALAGDGNAVHFVLEAYRHCKTIGVIGEGAQLLRTLGTGGEGAAAAGVVIGRNDPPSRPQFAQEFVAALAKHRHWSRANLESVPA
jgi:catalase